MHVLQFGKFYPPAIGGIEEAIYNISTGLHEQNIQITVLCVQHKSSISTQIENSPFKIIRARSYCKIASTAISPAIIFKLYHILKTDNIDLIHVHFPDPMAALALFFNNPRKPIIIHWHSDIIRQKLARVLFKPLQNWTLKKAKKIIVASPNYGSTSRDLKNFTNKIIVIPYGIPDINLNSKEVAFSKIESRESLDVLGNSAQILDFKKISNGKKVVFSLGRHVSYKGFNYLIEAFNLLSNDFILIIAGNGPLWEDHQKKILDLKLSDKVFLFKEISHKEKQFLYKLCDVFCLPSTTRAEAFGIVLIEALSYSKPIISTSILGSGVAWINQNEITGLVVRPRSSIDLAKAISMICLRLNYMLICHNARNRYLTEFRKELMVERLLPVYAEILK